MATKNPLVEKFSEFFVELQRQKAAVQAGRVAPSRAGARVPNASWEAIADLLRRQESDAGRTGVTGLQLYKEAQYAMAALADETFLVNMGEWPGRKKWLDYPLEMDLFQSAVAGDKIYKRIEKLLARRDPGERDLAEVYFNVLSLGFRGRYGRGRGRGRRAPPEVEELRRRLYDCFVEGRERAPGDVVSPQPYDFIDTGKHGGWIPSVTQALILLAVVIVSMIAVTFISRDRLTSGIQEQIQTLQSNYGLAADGG